MAELKELVVEQGLTPALIIDDYYDLVPQAEDIAAAVDDNDLLVERLGALAGEPQQRFQGAMQAAGLGDADLDQAIEQDGVVAALWALHGEGLLNADLSAQLFEIYEAEQASKKGQLDKLQAFLTELGIAFTTEGRENNDLGDAKIVFIDLYLGLTKSADALAQAKQRIARLVADKRECDRPIVVVMSTMTGSELHDLAHGLQRDASLLGCKFRVVSKLEFGTVLQPTLQHIVEDGPEAITISQWIDMWNDALDGAKTQFLKGVRLLDLSDYAYLKKYRLEAEGMGLGSYLVPLLLDYLSYCVETDAGLPQRAADLDAMEFKNPRAHLMPSNQTAVLAHARAFQNEKFVEAMGTQFDDPSAALELGDVIVKVGLDAEGKADLDNLPALCVLTQSCDTQQKNTDGFILLKGQIHKRDWLANVSAPGTRTDVFIWRDQQYYIDWDKAKAVVLTFAIAKTWLKKDGAYRRIARFRNVEALRIQQVFASNLTRVGTLVTPTSATPVAIKLIAKGADGNPVTVIQFSAERRMAAVMPARVVKKAKVDPVEVAEAATAAGAEVAAVPAPAKKAGSEAKHVLIFSDRFADLFIKQLEAFDVTLLDEQIRAPLTKLLESTDDLKVFARALTTGDKIDLAGQKVAINVTGTLPEKLPLLLFQISAPLLPPLFAAKEAA